MDVMIRIGGKSFRCTGCGANVFTKITTDRYSCNGCETHFITSDSEKPVIRKLAGPKGKLP